MPVDVLRRNVHGAHQYMAEGAAGMAGGRFGSAGMANRSRWSGDEVRAGEIRRNYERQMRSEAAALHYHQAEAAHQSAKARADLTMRRHKAQAEAEAAERRSNGERRRTNRDFGREEWENRRGQQ